MPENKLENLMPPPIWNPPQFDQAELLMIREIFGKTNFPGNACGAISRFIEKCDKHIANAEQCGPAIQPYPMAVDPEKGKPQG